MDNRINEIDELLKSIHFMTFKKNFQEFKSLGIHPGQIMILNLIYSKPGIKQKDIVFLTKREKATIAIALQRLEKSGFIEKKEDLNDKRSALFYLTKKGKETWNKTARKKTKEINSLFNSLNEQEIESIIKILHKIKMNLEKETTT